MRILVFLVVLLTLPTVIAEENYEIIGNTVQIDDENVYLGITPHTITDSGHQELKLTLKQYSGGLKVAFGCNSERAIPRSMDVYRNDQWELISSNFNKINYNFEGYDTWYTAQFTVASGVEYTTRLYLDIPMRIGDRSGKYYVAVWPSSYGNNIAQAITNGHFYYIDPWYQASTYDYRYEIFTNATSSTIPIYINDTGGVNGSYIAMLNATGGERRFVYSTAVGPSGTIAYANESFLFNYENTSAPGTGNNPTLVYPTNITLAFHNDNGTTAADSSTYGNDGVNNGTTFIDGVINGGLSFDGVNDYINTTAIVADVSHDATGTLVAWIRLNDSTPATVDTIMEFSDYSGLVGTSLIVHTNGRLQANFYVSGANQWRVLTGAGVFTAGQWHMVALRQNGTAPQLFIDGATVGSASITTDTTVWLADLTGFDTSSIGIETAGGRANYFNGTIDEVTYYSNLSLTDTQLKEVYWNGIDNLTSLGSVQGATAPVLTVNSPADNTVTTNGTVTFNATATDAEGDELTFYLIWNNTEVDNNANGQFSYVHGAAEGIHTWRVRVSDGPNNVTSVNRNIVIDFATITILNETDGSILDEEMNIQILDWDDFEELNSTVGVNVTFTDVDGWIGRRLIARASNTSSSDWEAVREIAQVYTAGLDYTIYQAKTSVDTTGFYQFEIKDFTDDWSDANVLFRRVVSSTLTTIHESFVDVENKATVYLLKDTEYQITVNKTDDTRVFGFYKATHDSLTTVLDVELNMVNITEWTERQYLNKDINFTTWQNGTTIFFAYDNIGTTWTLQWWVYNGSNISQQLFYSDANGSSTAAFSFSPPDANETHFSYFCANNSVFGYFCKWDTVKAVIDYDWLPITGPRVEEWVPAAVALSIILVIAGIFGGIDSKTGAIVLASSCTFFWYLGWLDLGNSTQGGAIIGLIIFMAILNKMTEGAQ